MVFETLFSNRITHVSQDGSRKFISLFIYIYANELALPLAFIYKEDSETL